MTAEQSPLSFFECWRNISQLERLKDLIRHQNRWAHQIDLARPLKKFGISEEDSRRYELIKQKINRLLPVAMRCAEHAGLSTQIVVREEKFATYPTEYENARYDIFLNYETLMSKDRPSAGHFDITIDLLDQIIGYYSEARFRKLIALLNPLKLIASILRVPITILEYMGFDSRGNIAETILSIIIRSLWLVFLAVLTAYFSGKSEIVRTFLGLIQK